MATRSGVLKGVMLRPGWSANKRLYTSEAIGKGIARLRDELSSGSSAPVIFPGHEAAMHDDITQVLGRITKVSQNPDGSAAFEADVPDTQMGRDYLALAKDGFIKGVSIRGQWMGDVKTEKAPDGSEGETSDDIRFLGLDATHRPGVQGAQVDEVLVGESDPTSVLFESLDDVAVFTESETDETAKALTPGTNYADPGYQKDGKKRYPCDSAAHCRAAWSYINMPRNSKAYSANQLSRIKGKIKSAAKKFGVEINAESETFTADVLSVLEAYASMSIDNGPSSISVSGYVNEPADLPALASKIAMGAMAALNSIDPDNDGDLDLPGSKGSSTEAVDHPAGVELQLCGDCQGILDDTNLFCPSCGLPVSAAETGTTDDNDMESTNVSGVENTPTDNAIKEPTNEEAPVADEITPVAEVTPAVDTNTAILAALTALTESVKELKTPAPVVETPAAEVNTDVTESAPKTFTEAELEALVAERTKTIQEEAVAAAQEAGSRKGFTLDNMSESQIVKDISEMDKDELHSVLGASMIQDPVFAGISNRAQRAVRGPTFFDA